jgi:hypothetical protein
MFQTYSRLVSGLLAFIFSMDPPAWNNIDTILDRMLATSICLSVATTLISTLIIAFCVLRFRWHWSQRRAQRKVLQSAPYTAMEIVVESSALYSVAAILCIPYEMDPGINGWYSIVYSFFSAMVVSSLIFLYLVSTDLEQSPRMSLQRLLWLV